MPYQIYQDGEKFCVRNKDTGESKGCSNTKSEAAAHMRALYAAEKNLTLASKEVTALVEQAIKEFDEFNDKNKETQPEPETKEDGEKSIYFATSYAELEESKEARERVLQIHELIREFPRLAMNVMDSFDIDDKEKAIKSLAAELSTRVSALAKKEAEENYQLSLDETDPEVSKTLIERVASAVKDALGLSEKETDSQAMMIYKDKESGRWYWLARYSNNFRDRDNPPEILSEQSHRTFVDKVEKGLAPYPELWLWHEPSLKIGKSTWLAYDDAGFAMASGYFYDGCEQVAEWLSAKKDVLVSHGMPPNTIVRDEKDPSVLLEYESRELSPLPSWVAANTITGFYSTSKEKKEANMAIPDGKKNALIEQWGMPAELLEKIEQINAGDAEKATKAGLESKETDEPVAEVETTEPVVEEEVTEPVADETEPEDKEKETDEETQPGSHFTKEQLHEIGDGLVSFLAPFMDGQEAVVKQVVDLSEQVKALNERMDEREKNVEETAADLLKDTPLASLGALIKERVPGSQETLVKGNTKLGKAKPKETKATAEDQAQPTLIPFVNNMLLEQPEEVAE
jgi:hypothetical protein